MYRALLMSGLVTGAAVFACGTETVTYVGAPPAPTTPGEDAGPPADGTIIGDASELGSGDSSPSSVTLTEIYTAKKGAAVQLVDVQFHGDDPTEAWAIGYGNHSVHIGKGITGDGVGTWEEMIDPAAPHFMYRPPAFAWGSEGLWGICGDNDNAQNSPRNEGDFFMGPALFTSDLAIFGKETEGGLGSHYDMLHNTSMCRGIAHVEKNVFWTFNGNLGSLELYDFHRPHVPGGDDHSDGEIYRYALGQVQGVEGISSHMFYDPSDKFLYVADTGNKRVVRLDTTKGKKGKDLPRRNEILAASGMMDDTSVEEVVAPGFLKQPSGLEIHNGLIFVSDTANGAFYAFDKAGNPIRSLDTGLPGGSLSGFTFGPDGRIWFTDRKRGKILRIDPPDFTPKTF